MTKYKSFNIEPGQTSWLDMPEDYKKAYFANKAAMPKKIKIKTMENDPLIRSYHMPASLDVFITGSSRPQLWPLFWESYKDMVKIRLPHEVTVHEDFVFPDQSNKVMSYVLELTKKSEVNSIDFNSPPIGLGPTMTEFIRKKSKSKYMFYIQEDWVFERPIDIDHILWVMDNNPKINLIFFNKIRNDLQINKLIQREHTYSGMKMCLYHGWAFLPGIWRMDFVKQRWQGSTFKPEGYFTNTAFGSHEMRANEAYCEKNIGAYLYGEQMDYRYVRHIGNDWRMAQWQIENGQPGGNHNSETMDKPYMAPWVIPYYKDGPTSRGDLSK